MDTHPLSTSANHLFGSDHAANAARNAAPPLAQIGLLEVASRDTWQALTRVNQWVEEHDYRGYEPFDGLSSWLRPLTCHNLLAERLLQQLIRQSPLNLRPLLGVRPQDSTKGRGYMAHGYLILYRITGYEAYLKKAEDCLTWLDRHRVSRFTHHSWSNHFDFAGRGGIYTKADPIIVWTSLIGHAFVEAFQITQNQRFLDIADSACKWILGLPRETTAHGTCISYLAHVQSSIHNANMLGAGLLARVGSLTHNARYKEVAASAINYSCSAQLPNGAWWYAEDPRFHWIDNFHTGYNLDSLDIYISATGDKQYRDNLNRGLAYYKATFFEATGRPKYYDSRTYPVDIQCIAQSLDTLSRFASRDPQCLALAIQVAEWAFRNMQHKSGYFYYRQYPLIKAKTPMLHWGQATMFKALCSLAQQLNVATAHAYAAKEKAVAV